MRFNYVINNRGKNSFFLAHSLFYLIQQRFGCLPHSYFKWFKEES